tara:strand:+ start:396 stop:1979 length:1584 start_codon:yes stop_codon:yes gene_type:complete
MPGMSRVLALPTSPGEVEDQTERYALPQGRYSLRRIQSKALYEMRRCGGLVAPIGVGHGKFLISALAATALQAQRPLLLVPPALIKQTEAEIKKFREHFRIHPDLKVMSYGKLSVASGARALTTHRPDLIIADECHHLRHRTAARTKRVIRYFQQNPSAKFVGLSGTFTSKGLADYSHLVELALREQSPVPLDFWELQIWAANLDVGGEPDLYERQQFSPLTMQYGGTPRQAFFRRLETAPGVVLTRDVSSGASIYMHREDLILPQDVKKALRDLENTWCTPGGEEIEDALAMARYRRQLLCGFYYEWEWPNDVPDHRWLTARAAWHRAVRNVLKRSTEGRDSPLLVATWAQRPDCSNAALVSAWNSWDSVRHRPSPPVRTIWINEYLINKVISFMTEADAPVIVWCEHRALLDKLRERGVPAYGAGTEIPDRPAHNCAMSIKAHGTGKNLQRWSHNLLTSFLPNGSTLEQLIGRTHRQGQEADEVYVHYFEQHRSVELDIEKAREIARYIQDTQGNRMKILAATWI